ncbi:hypothetical protein DSCO28_10200 [Desulfosarcina ovata subsp. sediminis]|uniref:Uncharacterized protein n=1 Tax=Desulfosarcina ovata subsp. sediminis TaxID=885957 RepID=A0A5K7ZGJ2_9BACT|nr:hypothetical protein [Desulfosarcina ovata]BBO80454.1 hypothetical protein DSCO28_10200 [Desulfosarcina ovata subsp. sediminis]
MPNHYSASLLRTLRNRIPIDAVIVDMLRLDIRPDETLLRFRCPLCDRFHTATNPKTNLLGFGTYEQLKDSHFKWIDSAIQDENTGREVKWSQSIAVGSEAYIKKIKETLGFRVRGRKIRQVGDAFELRETLRPYGSADFFEADNTHLWDWQR